MVIGANYEPNWSIMNTHPFAAFIYSVEDTLGLWNKDRKTEQVNRRPYDAHRDHFQELIDKKTERDDCLPRLDKILARLHYGSNLPEIMTRNHIDILECLYNELSHQPNISELSYENPVEFYIDAALIPLICIDIFAFKENATEHSIYFHLDRILKINNLLQNNEDATLNKYAVKEYLRRYINELFFEETKEKDGQYSYNPNELIQEVIGYMYAITKKSNQTCVKLNQIISICKTRANKFNAMDALPKIDSISAAYTAIIILQDISKKTKKLKFFYAIYNLLVDESDVKLNEYLYSFQSALNEDYRDINVYEYMFSREKNISPIKLLSDKKYDRIRLLALNATKLMATGSHFNKNPDQLEHLALEENNLSKMVSVPPQFETPYIYNVPKLFHLYAKNACEYNVLVFHKEIFTSILSLKNEDIEEDELRDFFSQYIPLIESLNLIQQNDALSALKILIDNNGYQPMFGFIKNALSILYIGLMYKIRRKEIKHQSLMRQVNDIINHQGFVSIPIIKPSYIISTEDGKPWLSEDEYYQYSLFFGCNTYNKIIIQAIYSYNFTVARHTSTYNHLTGVNDPQTLRVNLLDINYSSSMISHDLLERFNIISGKILAGLWSANMDSTPELFVNNLISAHVILPEDLTDNLIHCIDGSSLGVCLLDHLSIILFLSVPGDDVENIIALGKNTRAVELLFRHQHP